MTTMTLDDVETMEARRDELADKLEGYREREEQLSSELAHLHADGDGDSDRAEQVQGTRREIRETRTDLESALEVLDDRIVSAREEAAGGAAAEEIDRLRKRIGGISGQHGKDVEKAREHLERGIEILQRCEKNRHRQLHMKALAEALADRFEHDAGEFKILDGGDQRNVRKLRERIAGKLERPPNTPGLEVAGVEDIDPAAKAAHAADALRRGWDETDPRAVELLELVGEDIDYDPNTLKRAKREQEQSDREQAVMEAAMEFLESRVNGPTHIPGLYDQFQRLDLPAEPDMNRGNLLGRAANRLGLQRVQNRQGVHHYAPADLDVSEGDWRPASSGG